MNKSLNMFGLSIFVLVGFVLLSIGITTASKSIEACSWPSTMGKIDRISLLRISKNTKLETEEVEKINYDSSLASRSNHRIEVEYHYIVNNEKYIGSTLSFGYIASNSNESNRNILEKLAGSSSVKVHYQPDDPFESALSCGIHHSSLFILVLGIFVIILSITVYLLEEKRSDLSNFQSRIVILSIHVVVVSVFYYLESRPDSLLSNLEVTTKTK